MSNEIADPFAGSESVSEAAAACLLVAITFHYVASRLGYLEKTLKALAAFPVQRRHVVVFTNAVARAEQAEILTTMRTAGLTSGQDADLEIVPGLPYPYWLAWAHKKLLRETFGAADNPFTHFAYLEDDEPLTFENFTYFVAARKFLRPFGLVPSFARVEWSGDRGGHVSTDALAASDLAIRPAISDGRFAFVEMDSPYCGSFLLDRELAREYLGSRSFDRERSCEVTSWHVAERAAMGLTFEKTKAPFLYRSVVPVSVETRAVPRCAWLVHLPNNYADNPKSYFGKILMDELFAGDFNAGEAMRKAEGYRLYRLRARSVADLRRRWKRFYVVCELRLRTFYRRLRPSEGMRTGNVTKA